MGDNGSTDTWWVGKYKIRLLRWEEANAGGAEGGYIRTVFLDNFDTRHSKSSFNMVQHEKIT